MTRGQMMEQAAGVEPVLVQLCVPSLYAVYLPSFAGREPAQRPSSMTVEVPAEQAGENRSYR